MRKHLKKITSLTLALAMVMSLCLSAAHAFVGVGGDEEDSNSGMSRSSSENIVVVLDPGHDSTHAGGSAAYGGTTYREHVLVLRIAEACKAELETYDGVTVYLIRDGNSCPFPSSDSAKTCNEARVEYAESVDADLYVALHLNNSTNTSTNGVQVFYPNANYNESLYTRGMGVAESILSELVDLGLKNLGATYKNSSSGTYTGGGLTDYHNVIKNCKLAGITGIIVEHAYLTNADDFSEYLSSDSALQALGVADATGIAEYFGLSKKGSSEPSVDYSPVYDHDYYLAANADVAGAFGGDEEDTLWHFINYGMAEGRRASANFDVWYYRNNHGDLQSVYGDDLTAYYMHYINYGQAEGRVAVAPSGGGSGEDPGTGGGSGEDPDTGGGFESSTVYDGVDYASVYDYEYYLANNGDVAAAFSGDEEMTLWHFVVHGMKEGRYASAEFNVHSYLLANPQLRARFATDYPSYYLHYINTGKAAGTPGATGCTEMVEPTTVLDGVDYAPVYSYAYYTAQDPELAQRFRYDDTGALAHFVEYAMPRGIQGSESFDVNSYRLQYSDVRGLYGNDLAKYYLHYINIGYPEGRDGTGCTEMQGAVTVYDGVDYSDVYDYEYYLACNGDVAAVFGGDENATLRHFVNYGMAEGRYASAEFNVHSYLLANPQLRAAFRTDYVSYYMHYINTGKAAGTPGATGCTEMVEPATVLDGVDYAPVYDFAYYMSKNPELAAKYKYDDVGALEYFVEYGMAAGNQGSESFDVNSYRLQYSDVRGLYGDDLAKYYLHYINIGYSEGRDGTGCTEIQGAITAFEGVDYAAVYDYEYYLANNGDVAEAFAGDENAVIRHFILYGMNEGRPGNAEFDVHSYLLANPQLRAAFRTDFVSYYMHYINTGKAAGTPGATGCTEMVDPTTVYDGVDYAPVYDYVYYMTNNPELADRFRYDDNGALEYFVEYGMPDGDQGCESFDPESYRLQYSDVRGLYKYDMVGYYMHYLEYGLAEGRVGTGCTTLQNPTTVYDGVDYAPVYDYYYYIENNGDIPAALGYDEDVILGHFVQYGMAEARQGHADFNVRFYRYAHADIGELYGSDWKAYYTHYVLDGQYEGRTICGTYNPFSEETAELIIWNYFINVGMTEAGAAGMMGNIYAESTLRSNNLQNTYETSLGYSDLEYTQLVDNGTYTNFVHDRAGYGLCQWTHWSRKQKLLAYAQECGVSISDIYMQLEFLCTELVTTYPTVWNVLTSTDNLREASDIVLTQFERPANYDSEAKQLQRLAFGQVYYDRYAEEL